MPALATDPISISAVTTKNLLREKKPNLLEFIPKLVVKQLM